MVRTQVQLTPEHVALLRRMSASEGVSMSEAVRRCIEACAGPRQVADQRALRQRSIEALGSLKGLPADLGENHDEYVAEASAT